jgi:hypothetical protein
VSRPETLISGAVGIPEARLLQRIGESTVETPLIASNSSSSGGGGGLLIDKVVIEVFAGLGFVDADDPVRVAVRC